MDAFVERVAQDFIIGFLFQGKDLARIKRFETALALTHLQPPGGGARYGGQPIAAVHKPLRINAGQFRRRLALLRTVLSDRGVPDDIVARWVAHDARLESAITDGTDCLADDGGR